MFEPPSQSIFICDSFIYTQVGARINRVRLVMAAVAIAAASCDSPTEPDPRIVPVVGSPWRLSVALWDFDTLMTSLRVEARWGDLYGTTKDVTNDATYQSSNASIMRVARAGQVASIAPGDATLTIAYRDVSISHLMRVFAGESPLLVLTPETTTYVGTSIRDAQTGAGIEGVLVEIIGGHNADRTTTTDRLGFYGFYPPFVCGPLTMRASKAGYQTRVGSSVMCENGTPDLALMPGS
jgi:hypothetical protein